MKTLFQMGLARQDLFGRQIRGLWLGQAEAAQVTLTKGERSVLASRLQAASEKKKVIDTWIQEHPNAGAKDLGSDLTDYQDNLKEIETTSPKLANLLNALKTEGQEEYKVGEADLKDTETWIAAVNALHYIVSRHPTIIKPVPKADTTPLIIGGVAVAGIVALILALS